MTNRVGQYQITEEVVDVILLEECLEFFKSKGKKKVYPYAKGQVCFHHRKSYWFVSPYTMKYAPRHKANERWYKAEDLEGVWEGINAWLDYRDRKAKEEEV